MLSTSICSSDLFVGQNACCFHLDVEIMCRICALKMHLYCYGQSWKSCFYSAQIIIFWICHRPSLQRRVWWFVTMKKKNWRTSFASQWEGRNKLILFFLPWPRWHEDQEQNCSLLGCHMKVIHFQCSSYIHVHFFLKTAFQCASCISLTWKWPIWTPLSNQHWTSACQSSKWKSQDRKQ